MTENTVVIQTRINLIYCGKTLVKNWMNQAN